jgi:hypothetical protein
MNRSRSTPILSGAAHLALVLLHHDELPLHARCLESARVAAADQLVHVLDDVVELAAHPILGIRLLVRTIQGHDEVFETAVNQPVQIPRRRIGQVGAQIRPHVPGLGVRDHVEHLFVQQRLSPVVQVRLEEVIGQRVEVLLEVIERQHGLPPSECAEPGGTQRAA